MIWDLNKAYDGQNTLTYELTFLLISHRSGLTRSIYYHIIYKVYYCIYKIIVLYLYYQLNIILYEKVF